MLSNQIGRHHLPKELWASLLFNNTDEKSFFSWRSLSHFFQQLADGLLFEFNFYLPIQKNLLALRSIQAHPLTREHELILKSLQCPDYNLIDRLNGLMLLAHQYKIELNFESITHFIIQKSRVNFAKDSFFFARPEDNIGFAYALLCPLLPHMKEIEIENILNTLPNTLKQPPHFTIFRQEKLDPHLAAILPKLVKIERALKLSQLKSDVQIRKIITNMEIAKEAMILSSQLQEKEVLAVLPFIIEHINATDHAGNKEQALSWLAVLLPFLSETTVERLLTEGDLITLEIIAAYSGKGIHTQNKIILDLILTEKIPEEKLTCEKLLDMLEKYNNRENLTPLQLDAMIDKIVHDKCSNYLRKKLLHVLYHVTKKLTDKQIEKLLLFLSLPSIIIRIDIAKIIVLNIFSQFSVLSDQQINFITNLIEAGLRDSNELLAEQALNTFINLIPILPIPSVSTLVGEILSKLVCKAKIPDLIQMRRLLPYLSEPHVRLIINKTKTISTDICITLYPYFSSFLTAPETLDIVNHFMKTFEEVYCLSQTELEFLQSSRHKLNHDQLEVLKKNLLTNLISSQTTIRENTINILPALVPIFDPFQVSQLIAELNTHFTPESNDIYSVSVSASTLIAIRKLILYFNKEQIDDLLPTLVKGRNHSWYTYQNIMHLIKALIPKLQADEQIKIVFNYLSLHISNIDPDVRKATKGAFTALIPRLNSDQINFLQQELLEQSNPAYNKEAQELLSYLILLDQIKVDSFSATLEPFKFMASLYKQIKAGMFAANSPSVPLEKQSFSLSKIL